MRLADVPTNGDWQRGQMVYGVATTFGGNRWRRRLRAILLARADTGASATGASSCRSGLLAAELGPTTCAGTLAGSTSAATLSSPCGAPLLLAHVRTLSIRASAATLRNRQGLKRHQQGRQPQQHVRHEFAGVIHERLAAHYLQQHLSNATVGLIGRRVAWLETNCVLSHVVGSASTPDVPR